jgi:glycine dehydrogenase subunit 2
MTVNPSGWRPSTPSNEQGQTSTVTGNRALMLEEPLLFEIGDTERTGVDFESWSSLADAGTQEPESAASHRTGPRPSRGNRLGELERTRPIGLAGLTEPEAVRHYTRLSRQN